MKITLVKKIDNTFVCAFNSDYEKLKKIKPNVPVEYTFTNKRNIKFHRKMFALVKMAYDNQEVYNNIDRFRKDLTIESGFYEEYINFKGEKIMEAKSISFAKMEEDEFEKLYNRFIDTIIRIFKYERQDIINNLSTFY